MTLRFRLLVSAVVLLECVLVYVFVAQHFPMSGDDYSYLYQARLFAAGKLYAQDPLYDYRDPLNRCVTFSCLRDEGGRRFSKYPAGWPAVLAVGVLLRAPWLVQPLLTAILTFLFLGYVAERIGPGLVKIAGLLLIACVFYAYYGASYRPHMATALCVFAAFLAHERSSHDIQRRARWVVIAASLLGASALMRYTDWVPLGLWIAFDLARRRRYRDLVIFACCLGVVASTNLMWDWLLSGHPLIAPTHLGGSVGDHDRLSVSWDSLVVTAGRLAVLTWVFPPVLLIVRYWNKARKGGSDPTPLMLFLGNLGLYSLFTASVGGPGPRYLLSYFPFLVLVVVDLYARFIEGGSFADHRWWRIMVATQLLASVTFVTLETYTMYWRRDVERSIAGLSDRDAAKRIVLLATGTLWTDVTDLTHNPPDLASADTLYLANCAPDDVEMLEKRFAGRDVFAYTFPGHLVRAAVR